MDRNWQTLYDSAARQDTVPPRRTDQSSDSLFDGGSNDSMTGSPYQMAGKYIVMPKAQGLILIDQHRAHALLLYDQCRKRLNEHNGEVQQLLFPEIWDVGLEDEPLVQSFIRYFRDLGFDLEPLTRGSYNVTGVPALLGCQNALLSLQQILDSLRELGGTAADERERRVAWAMAESAAMPYGRKLSEEEMTDMLTRLFQRSDFRLTPSGKTVAVLLDGDMIGNLF